MSMRCIALSSIKFTALCVTLISSLLTPHIAFAAEPVLVKLEPPQLVSVSIGEPLPLSVLLLAQGQFAGPTYFDLPEIEGAIIMQVSQRPILGTQQISGETYSTARHDFAVYAQRGGSMRIPAITVRFGSKTSFDQPTTEHSLQTEFLDIKVTVPPGSVAGEVIVSARDLSAIESWSPKPGNAKVGDAFTRTITLRAREVPAMLLPPPNFDEPAGFAIYPKPPQIRDESKHGEFVGVRIDTVTYISEHAGKFEIPELAVRWWDPDKKQWQIKRFPAATLEVADNPALAPQFTSGTEDGKQPVVIKSRIGWLVLMLAVIATLWFARAPVSRSWQAWRARRAVSEAEQWRRLRKASARGVAVDVYRELDRWLAHFDMSTHQLTVATADGVSERLTSISLGLQRCLIGLDPSWDTRLFSEELAALRRHIYLSADAEFVSPLPPLNPTRPGIGLGRQDNACG